MWIKMSKERPPSDTGVLVTDGKVITCAEWDNDDYYWSGHGLGGPEWEFHFRSKDITHWMPLPRFPSEEIRENILKTIIAAQKVLDEQNVPKEGRRITYWNGERAVVVDIDTGEVL
ncbi:MAG: DUF551 domain-containing protein [Thermoplasmata archaeon]|nr:DUF551 domain-containing protein [Thermoplasmata archaeon]